MLLNIIKAFGRYYGRTLTNDIATSATSLERGQIFPLPLPVFYNEI